jgi:hypothetical protein
LALWRAAREPVAEWILYRDSSPQRRLIPRERYSDLRCSQCGKVDAYAALARGVGADVRIRSNRDVVETGAYYTPEHFFPDGIPW